MLRWSGWTVLTSFPRAKDWSKMFFKRPVVFLFLCLMGLSSALAGDTIWTGVVAATNARTPDAPPKELVDFAPRLKQVFGYNQFELAGSASNEIEEQTEKWFVPCPIFQLSMRARKALSKEARGGYLINLQLFQNKVPVVDTEIKLAPGSPLFIRGPQWGTKQLLIVVLIKP